MKYLIIIAVTVATTRADARIVFQQSDNDFIPRNYVERSTTTTTTTTSRTTTTSTSTEMTPTRLCPGNEDWCDTPTDYPEQSILRAALSQNNTIRSLFDTQEIISRNSFGEFVTADLENICSVKTEYIMPRAAKNKEGEYKYIVNHPSGAEEYIQRVKVTKCTGAEQECGHGLLEGSGVRTKCRQEFSDHKLVALSPTGEELQVETFQFPSCCSCYISPVMEF